MLRILIGLLAGTCSRLFGIGGGFILVPSYIFLLGFGLHEAIVTSLATIALFAIPGAISHAWLGNINFVVLVPLVAGALTSSQMDAKLCLAPVRKGCAC